MGVYKTKIKDSTIAKLRERTVECGGNIIMSWISASSSKRRVVK